jgi:hypothetical protein
LIGTPARFLTSDGPPIQLPGPWRVAFPTGGPELPAARTVERLTSWASWGGEDLKRFSGTARYTTSFQRPAGDSTAWQLDLGNVHESARVRLNGQDLGTLIGPAFHIAIPRAHLVADNVLEIDVSNLMANRIAALDRAGVPWRKFYNVNFPARLAQNRGSDGLFSAATWEPLDSGLFGPVTLRVLSAK